MPDVTNIMEKKLEFRENDLFRQIIDVIGKPQIAELNSREELAGNFMKWFIRFISNVLPVSTKKQEMSPWAILTRNILNGMNKKYSQANAIRFGHFELMEGDVELNHHQVKKALYRLFSEKEHFFPWIFHDGIGVKNAPRIENIDFKNTEIQNAHFYDFNARNGEDKSKIPLILVVDNLANDNLFLENKIVAKEIEKRPFLLVLKKYRTLGNYYVLAHLISNHEFFDGLPASYYLHKFMKELFLTPTSFYSVDKALIRKILRDADVREHYSEEKSFQVETRIISEKMTQDLYEFFSKIRQRLEQENIVLSFEVFVHVFLFKVLILEKRVKVCTLKFQQKVSEQLDFFELPEIEKLYDCMVSKPHKIREKFAHYLVKDKYLGLYCHGKNVVDLHIRPLTERFSERSIRFLCKISEYFGSSRSLIGQLVITGVPSEIKIGNQIVNLGNGFGGPSCAPFQDAALTIGFVRNKHQEIEQIVIRRKYKECV